MAQKTAFLKSRINVFLCILADIFRVLSPSLKSIVACDFFFLRPPNTRNQHASILLIRVRYRAYELSHHMPNRLLTPVGQEVPQAAARAQPVQQAELEALQKTAAHSGGIGGSHKVLSEEHISKYDE